MTKFGGLAFDWQLCYENVRKGKEIGKKERRREGWEEREEKEEIQRLPYRYGQYHFNFLNNVWSYLFTDFKR